MNFITVWVLLNAIWWCILCAAVAYAYKEDGMKPLKECGIMSHVVGVLLSIPLSIYILMGGKTS